MDLPGDVFIYANWGEKFKLEAGQITRGAKIISADKPNEITIEETDIAQKITWKESAYQGSKIAMQDNSGNSILIGNILTTEVTPEGKGKIKIDVEAGSEFIGNNIKRYIIFPDTKLTYVVKLEAIDFVKAKDIDISGPNCAYQNTMKFCALQSELAMVNQPDLDIPESIGNEIIATEYRWHGLPYGKQYKVKVAAMYGHDRRTLSEFVDSGVIKAGICVLNSLPTFSTVANVYQVYNGISCKFNVDSSIAKIYQQIKVIWKYYDTQAEASADNFNFFAVGTDEYSMKTLPLFYGKPNWNALLTMDIPTGKWVRIKARGLTNDGIYCPDGNEFNYITQSRATPTAFNDWSIPAPVHQYPPQM
jgi:hypothetical protein